MVIYFTISTLPIFSSIGDSSSSKSNSGPKSSSCSVLILMLLYLFIPVPAGISFPMITFSFSPINGSTFPLMAASVSTLVVSWKEAADKKDSVAREALVIPSKVRFPVAGVFPSASVY